MKYPFVTIVIPNHNGWERKTIEVCLESLLNLDYPNFEIMVVDNCSTDNSVENIENNFKVSVVRNTENSLTKAINLGIKKSRGKYVAIFNDDTVIKPNAMKEIIKVMEHDKRIGVAAFMLMLFFDKNKIDSAGDSFDFYGNSKLIGFGEIYSERYNRVREVLAVGSAYVLRKEIVEEVGYFDEMFPFGYTDGDFCFRARLRGYKVVCVPNAVVFHIRASSYRSPFEESMKILDNIKFDFYKTQFALLIKNYELKNLVKSLPIVFFMYLLMSLYQLFFKGPRDALFRPKHALLRLKSILWVIRHSDYLLKQRYFVQKCVRKLPDTEIKKYMVENQFSSYLKQLGKW